MKRTLYTMAALTTGAILALIGAAPASAHVTDAYHGNRGHAWTNTAHTRIGVQDTRCDNLAVWAEVWTTDGPLPALRDLDGCSDGHTAYVLEPGNTVISLRVCAETRGCGEWQSTEH